MPGGTFFSINTALRGLMAHQKAMQTTAHNIANASTEGYTRQRVVMVPTPAYPVPAMSRPGGQGWQVGTGVDVQEVRRIRDEFLDQQIRKETGTLGQWEQIQYVLQQVEVVFNEPSDTGLSTLLSQFWAAWQELSKNAESLPVRRTVIETANALAEAFRHSATQLNQIKNDIDKSIELKVQEVNSIAQQIADLNGQIKNIIAAGDQPNDLLDQRDLLLDKLSKIIDFTVTPKSNGSITVTLGNGSTAALVDDTTTQSLKVTLDTTDAKFIFQLGSTTIDVSNGELLGLNKAYGAVTAYLEDLNTLAGNMAHAINEQHKKGYDLYGTIGVPFFAYKDNNNQLIEINNSSPEAAQIIQVNPEIIQDVSKIAAAGSWDAINPPRGDGSNALKIAQLQNIAVVALFNSTFDDYYKNFIAKLGVNAHEAERMTTNQGVLVAQLTNRRESISGVSIDEEMAYMIQFLRGYEAAARLMTTLDEMLDVLINRMAVH